MRVPHGDLTACAGHPYCRHADPTIRVNFNLIQIDVTVLDKTGKRVPDLAPEDFEVFRDGKRQLLKSTLWVPGQRVAVAASPVSTSTSTPDTPKPIRPQEVRRTNPAYGAFVSNAKPGKEANSPNLETQVVLFHDGKVVYTGKRTPFQPEGFTEGMNISVMGNMQLGANIATGEYILQLAIRDLEAPRKQQYFVRSIDFEVPSPATAGSK